MSYIKESINKLKTLIDEFDSISNITTVVSRGNQTISYHKMCTETVPNLINHSFRLNRFTETQADNLYNMLNSEDKENHLVVFTIVYNSLKK